MRDYQFLVADPVLDGAGWWFVARGLQAHKYGPFATEQDARAQRERLFARWDSRARSHGGWAWKSTHAQWRVTVPEGVRVWGEPLRSAPCAVHGTLPGEAMV